MNGSYDMHLTVSVQEAIAQAVRATVSQLGIQNLKATSLFVSNQTKIQKKGYPSF